MLYIIFIDLPVILWLNKDMYSKQFNEINQGEIKQTIYTWIGAIVAYLLLAFSIYQFIVTPGLDYFLALNRVKF